MAVEHSKAIFLDKDGTLTPDVPYNANPELVTLFPEAGESLAAWKRAGYKLIVVSNQSGVARGYFEAPELDGINRKIQELLQPYDVQIDAFYYCTHGPKDGCDCRKPQPGMIEQAARDHNIDVQQSWLIGDILHDVEAGKRAGCRSILVNNGNETEWDQSDERRPDARVHNLAEASAVILGKTTKETEVEDTIHDILAEFSTKKVLVIGEGMLDVYLSGGANRICREAPVPIVDVEDVKFVPGGAANTAVNLAGLGAEVQYVTVVGRDHEAEILKHHLSEHGVRIDHIMSDSHRQTMTKQRVLAGEHMLVRFDAGSQDEISEKYEDEIIAILRQQFHAVDAVVVSDYGYGILTRRVIDTIAALQAERETILALDAKSLDKYQKVGATVAKPNYGELTTLVSITSPAHQGLRAAQLEKYGDTILAATGTKYVAATIDKEGALIFQKDKKPYRTFSQPVENSKAAGAGDTYTSALTLTLASGASIEQAAELAQAAAMVILQKSGTASVTLEELQLFFKIDGKYVPDWYKLQARLEQLRAEGKRIVFTNGCFDIMHSGHVRYLGQAKSLGDVLVVALNTDASVKRLKGDSRPINTLDERARVMAGLEAVDFVTAFPQDTPIELLKVLRPEIYVKGGDYTREKLPEVPTVESYGGHVEIVSLVDGRSTTNVIKKIKQQA